MAKRGRKGPPKPKKVANLMVTVYDNGNLEIKPRGGPVTRSRWEEFQAVTGKLLKKTGLTLETQIREVKPKVVKRAVRKRAVQAAKPAPPPPPTPQG